MKVRKPGAQALGRSGEEIACRYLQQKKYDIVARGFRMFRGEIDIIARDGATLVFIEVKARADESHGRPEESVTPGKQRQIRKLAQGYLLEHPAPDVDCRFDVIAILFSGPDDYRLEHFIDAF
jgi:putative endonuclease